MKLILCADLHLSHAVPLFRSPEPDWYLTQRGYLNQLDQLAEIHNAPVVCAGDVFDKWNVPPETINLALKYLPKMYAVPGQHDLPHHRYADIRRSAYWTLVEAGKIVNLEPGKPIEVGVGAGTCRLHGFPWGHPITPLKGASTLVTEVAVVHAYMHTRGTGYVGAPKDSRIKHLKGRMAGYDLVAVGDNHAPFDLLVNENRTLIHNNGAFMRRKADEAGHRPSAGILKAGGYCRHYLDTSKDRVLDGDAPAIITALGFQGFVEELLGLGQSALDFREAIDRLLERQRVPDSVKRIVLTALDPVAPAGRTRTNRN